MRRLQKGFTLAELLVALAVIGVISSFVLVRFRIPNKEARDEKRRSDLRQYEAALTTYAFNNDGHFVAGSSAQKASDICIQMGVAGCAEDDMSAEDAQFGYRYWGNSAATEYVLWARMEATDDYYVICSDGAAGNVADAPLSSQCPNDL